MEAMPSYRGNATRECTEPAQAGELECIPVSTRPSKVALVKILPSCWVKDFLDGNLYLNTNTYFGEVDRSDIVRFDPHDGIDESRQVKQVEIADDNGDWIPIGGVINPVTFRSTLSSSVNMLCMYAMNDRAGERFDERNLKFGDAAVYISDALELIRRVKAAAAEVNKDVRHGLVEYVEKEFHDGPMGPFRKFSEHSYQNEFRFVLTAGNGEACRLFVGDLRDITVVGPSAEIPKMWQSLNAKDVVRKAADISA